MFGAVRNCVSGKIAEVSIVTAAKEFGRALEQMCELTTALEVGTEVEEFPRLCHQVSLIPSENRQSTPPYAGRIPPEVGRKSIEDRHEAYIDVRSNPQSPSKRINIHSKIGHGGWNVIDYLSVTPCARMPNSMQTVEFVPNSLQEEWVTT
jgi:hypothetical protein